MLSISVNVFQNANVNAPSRGISDQLFARQPLNKDKTQIAALVHLPDQLVDLLFPVAQVAALNVVLKLPLAEAARWAVELERPQEVGRRLEVGANSADLVDQILHTDHAVLAQVLLDDLIVSQGNPLLINLAVTTLCQSRQYCQHLFKLGSLLL